MKIMTTTKIKISPKIATKINNAIKEFQSLEKGAVIKNPTHSYKIASISEYSKKVINSNINNATISRLSIKHIVERRGILGATDLINSIPDVVSNPSKIAKSSLGNNRYLFAKMNGKARASVLEVIKNPDGNQVVSAYYMDDKTFRKLVDISGRSDVPPSIPPKGRSTASEISAIQKSTIPSIAPTKKSINNQVVGKFNKTYDNNRSPNNAN